MYIITLIAVKGYIGSIAAFINPKSRVTYTYNGTNVLDKDRLIAATWFFIKSKYY
jgi:hypothetical protein